MAVPLTRKQKAKLVVRSMRINMRTTWQFESSRDPDVKYDVIREADGKLSCNCPRWANKRKDIGYRTCSHVDRVIMTQNYNVEVRGDYEYVID